MKSPQSRATVGLIMIVTDLLFVEFVEGCHKVIKIIKIGSVVEPVEGGIQDSIVQLELDH